MYVCMYVCMHVCMYVCIYVCVYAWMDGCTYCYEHVNLEGFANEQAELTRLKKNK